MLKLKGFLLSAGGGANGLGYYLVSRSTNAPTNAVNLGALTSGLLKITVSATVATPATATADSDYVTPSGAGTLTNKTLGQPSIQEPTTVGGEKVTQLGTVAGLVVTPTGTDDGATWGYQVVGVDVNGNETAGNTEVQTIHGGSWANYNGTTVKNTLSWTALTGIVSYKVYRKTVPAGGSTGIIATGVTAITYVDDKSAGASETVSTVDATGSLWAIGPCDLGIRIIPATGNISPTAQQCYGGIIIITGAGTVSLPAGVKRMSITVYTYGAVAVSVDPNGTETIVLNGTVLGAGNKVTNTSTSGDMVCFVNDGNRWYLLGNNVNWTDGG